MRMPIARAAGSRNNAPDGSRITACAHRTYGTRARVHLKIKLKTYIYIYTSAYECVNVFV